MRSTAFLFCDALKLLAELREGCLVEIGSIRDPNAGSVDGHSTLALARAAKPTWSVDVDPKATLLTASMLGDSYSHVQCVTSEGIKFLEEFPYSIGLLYLDGPHPDREDGRAWAARAFTAALPKITPRAVLLIDDTDLPRRGKGEFAIPLAEGAGFELIQSGRQSLLVR